MISDTAQLHGAFFIQLFEFLEEPISIRRMTELSSGFYLLADRVPVFLKLSTKRKGPWTFNFLHSHQMSQKKAYNTYGECFTCLICGCDGMAGINMAEFRQILDGNLEEQECVSVRRGLNKMYQIKGKNGILESKVSRGSIFFKINEFILKG
jgi:hypothetical protein